VLSDFTSSAVDTSVFSTVVGMVIVKIEDLVAVFVLVLVAGFAVSTMFLVVTFVLIVCQNRLSRLDVNTYTGQGDTVLLRYEAQSAFAASLRGMCGGGRLGPSKTWPSKVSSSPSIPRV
jgi:hypothetical protein